MTDRVEWPDVPVTGRVRLRVGRKVPTNLYVQLGDRPADTDPQIGVVWSDGRSWDRDGVAARAIVEAWNRVD